MTNRLIVLTALAGLLAAGCSSDKGGAYDHQTTPGYGTGSSENPNPNTPPNGSGGPVRGPGTGGMGGTSSAPSDTSKGTETSDSTATPDNSTAPSRPDSSLAPSSPDSSGQPPQ